MNHLQARRILAVDDELSIRKSLQQCFNEAGSQTEVASDLKSARRKIEEFDPELIILDNRLPDGRGSALLKSLKESSWGGEIIMMTAHSSTADAVEAMKNGAADYIIKPFDLDEIMMVVGKVLEHHDVKGQVQRLRTRDQAVASVENLIGSSPEMDELRNFVERVASSGARTILITGESGTGKGMVARAIHNCSPDRNRPFLDLTCTALPEALLESELFGHEKGSFTDAKQAKRGLFEEADGGTIFLDEIGDMPSSLQAKLLRFLESHRFRRVGGLKDLHVNCRIIAATHRDLAKAIEDGTFRSDLFYRLNVIPIEIPPLRERPQDIDDLVPHFVEQFSSELGKPLESFDEVTLALLRRHQWPGNVRELRNCIERAALLANEQALSARDLPRELRQHGGEIPDTPGHPFVLPQAGVVLEEMIRDLLDQALHRCEGNKSRSAELLGIHRDQVRYWVKKYNLTQWIRTRPKANASGGGD